MKVRIKQSGQTRPVDVGPGDATTLSELRDRVADIFHLQTPFNLSLNNTDAVEGDDQTLTQLGIVSGDLLYVTDIDSGNRGSAAATSSTSATAGFGLLETAGSASTSSTVNMSAESEEVPMSIDNDEVITGAEGGSQGEPTPSTSGQSQAELTPSVSDQSQAEPVPSTSSQMQTEPTPSTSSQSDESASRRRRAMEAAACSVPMTSGPDPSMPSTSGLSAKGAAGSQKVAEAVSSCSMTSAPTPSTSSSKTSTLSAARKRKQPKSSRYGDLLNRCMRTPLLCREATVTNVPAALRSVYNDAGCNKLPDALWVAIHALMLEENFKPAQDEGLGVDWNKHGFYKRTYTHKNVRPNVICTVMGVPMDKYFLVHGFVSGQLPAFKTEKLPLRLNDFVIKIRDDASGVFVNLERLSWIIKDRLCLPLMAHFSDIVKYHVHNNILSLSSELRLKLLSYLPAESLVKMGQVCKQLKGVYRDSWLWRELYRRDFGFNAVTGNSTNLRSNWYDLYKKEYFRQTEYRKAAKLRYQVITGIPPWINPRPGYYPPLLPPLHSIIGGDHDLNPEFSSGIPYPMPGGPAPDPAMFRPPPEPPRPPPEEHIPGPSAQRIIRRISGPLKYPSASSGSFNRF